MKSILNFLILVVATISFSAAAETDVVISADNPINCEKQNSEHINGIYLVEKTAESDDSVTFSFITTVGACKNQQITTSEIDITKHSLIFVHDGINIPWKDKGVKSDIQFNADTNEAFITLTFNKKELFKRKSTRFFAMTFNPYSKLQVAFNWSIYLTQDSNQEVSMFLSK